MDGDRGEGGATIKCIVSNTYYGVWDDDGGDGGTQSECIISNAGYRVAEGDRDE